MKTLTCKIPESEYDHEEMDDTVKFAKQLVEHGDLSALQNAFTVLRGVDIPWLFQKLYLHACLKGRVEIAEWLQNSVFPTLDPIAQIALRQGFAYGRYLLNKANTNA